MSVRFKFTNDLEYHSIPCDGLNISVRDLKRSIIRQNKLGKITDFDLGITNAMTNQPYNNEKELISKNTTVLVRRQPLENGKKKVWEEDVLGTALSLQSASGQQLSAVQTPLNITSMLNLGKREAGSEMDQIENMISHSTDMYQEKNWTKYKGQKALPEGARPPPNWKCSKCAQNHWLSDCPHAGLEIKRTTGIPRSFLHPSENTVQGAKINPQGLIVVNEMERAAYSERKLEQSPWVADTRPSAPKINIPAELLCPICKDILNDAVMMPCCAGSACDECARDGIINSDGSKCPICEESANPEELIPYRMYRDKVDKFSNQTGYTKQAKLPAVPPKESLAASYQGTRPTLPDIVLPDPHDIKFNMLINQKGSEQVVAPNLDFTFVPENPSQSKLVLPELFSAKDLFSSRSPSLQQSPAVNTSLDSNKVGVGSAPSSPAFSTASPAPSAVTPTKGSDVELLEERPSPSKRSSADPGQSPAAAVGRSPGPGTRSPPRRRGDSTPRTDERAYSLSPGRRPEQPSSPYTRDDRSTSYTRDEHRTTDESRHRRELSPPSPLRRRSRSRDRAEYRRASPPPSSGGTPVSTGVPPPGVPIAFPPPFSSAPVAGTTTVPPPGVVGVPGVPGVPPPGVPPPGVAPPGVPGHPPFLVGAPPQYAPPAVQDPLSAFLSAMAVMDRRRGRSPPRPRSPPRAYRQRSRSRSRERYNRSSYSTREKYKTRGSTPERYRYKPRDPPASKPVEDTRRDEYPASESSRRYDDTDRRYEESSSYRSDGHHDKYRQEDWSTTDRRYEETSSRRGTEDKRRSDDSHHRSTEEWRHSEEGRRYEESRSRRAAGGKYDERYDATTAEAGRGYTTAADGKGYDRDDHRGYKYKEKDGSRKYAGRERRVEYKKEETKEYRKEEVDENRTPSLSPSPGDVPRLRSGSRGGEDLVYEDDILEERERLSRGHEEKKEKKSKKNKKKAKEDESDEDSSKKRKKKKKKDKRREEEEKEEREEKEEEQDKDKEKAEEKVTPLVSYESQEDENEESAKNGEERPADDPFVQPPGSPVQDEKVSPPSSKFKNSFNAITPAIEPVKLPTLVFDDITTKLSIKEEPVVETSEVKQDVVKPKPGEVAIKAEPSAMETLLAASPPPITKSQDMFEPDNPLVKNEMDDDFKKELTALQDLKSQLGTSNTREVEEDVKLKVAEPDSTMSEPALIHQGWEQEVPGMTGLQPVEKEPLPGETLLIRALANIKHDDDKPTPGKRRKREHSPALAPPEEEQEEEEGRKKKKKKKKRVDSDSEHESNKEEDKEDGSDSEEGEGEDGKRKKKKKKGKKKKKIKVGPKMMKQLVKLQAMNKDELKDLVKKAKKKKKKKKKDGSESEREGSGSPGTETKKKRKKSKHGSSSREGSKMSKRSPREESSRRSKERSSKHQSEERLVRRRRSEDRSGRSSRNSNRNRSPVRRERSKSIEEIVRRDKEVRSVKDRLGSRDMAADTTDDERHVKTKGVNIQVRLDNRSTEQVKGRLSSVVEKKINERSRHRSRSRDRRRR